MSVIHFFYGKNLIICLKTRPARNKRSVSKAFFSFDLIFQLDSRREEPCLLLNNDTKL
jgi:hypothetical protein